MQPKEFAYLLEVPPFCSGDFLSKHAGTGQDHFESLQVCALRLGYLVFHGLEHRLLMGRRSLARLHEPFQILGMGADDLKNELAARGRGTHAFSL